MEKIIEVSDSGLIREIFGSGDKKKKFIEKEFGVTLGLREQGILVKGEANNLERAVSFLHRLIKLSKEGLVFSGEELSQYSKSISQEVTSSDMFMKIKVNSKRKFVVPMTEGQKKYISSIEKYDITFSIGPAGTGKTYLAMAMAVNYL
ncbi:MAG: PhoH family protein, partial [Candidatus Omnitrophica bacterium]|nr:PhoH family protein [Candidatus Omnitrophota bacterium]